MDYFENLLDITDFPEFPCESNDQTISTCQITTNIMDSQTFYDFDTGKETKSDIQNEDLFLLPDELSLDIQPFLDLSQEISSNSTLFPDSESEINPPGEHMHEQGIINNVMGYMPVSSTVTQSKVKLHVALAADISDENDLKEHIKEE